MSEKIIGYIMTSVGILIILACALSVFNILLTKSVPISFVSLGKISVNFSIPGGGDLSSITPQIGIPTEALDFGLNLTIYLFVLGFIANMGFRLASLGVMLIRPIKVDLKSSTS